METEIAEEVAKLPRLERFRVLQDVEGRNLLAAAEPSKLVAIGLHALDQKVANELESKNGASSVRSLLKSKLASDVSLRIKMLRAESFDSDLAFERLVKYLKLLQEVLATCGEPRHLELARDFDAAERQWLEFGSFQLLLFRDHAGRRVAGSFDIEIPKGKQRPSRTCLLKMALYLFQAASEDDTTQKEGL
ncbi:MAG: hypothetical protein SGILL_009913, partial [Bacillariaceae sp.]